jgi:gliding motility-associated-like protein
MIGNANGSAAPLIAMAPYPTAPTTGTITMIGANGTCTNMSTHVVTVIPNPTVVVTPAVANICFGTSATFSASGASTYAWNPGTNLNTTVGPVITANPPSTTMYNVIGNTAGCFGLTQQALVNVIPNPTVTINPATPTICAGSQINLTANGATSYDWSPGTGLSSTTGANVAAGPSATQTYSVLGTANTCTHVGMITVTVIPVPNLITTASQYTICAGYPTNITVNGANSFSWSPSTGLSSTTGPFVVANPANSTIYTIVGNNGLCVATGSIAIEVVPQPNVNVSSPNFYLCEGQSTTISATGAQSYSWTPSQTLSSSVGSAVTATPPVSTNYTVIGYNSMGTVTCAEVHSYSIVVIPYAKANLPAEIKLCQGEEQSITVSGGNTYSWVPSYGLNMTYGPTVIASPSAGVIYTVYSSFNGNCGGTGTVAVTVLPRPVVFAGRDTTFNLDAYKFIKANGTGTLSWIQGEEIWCKVCPESQIYATRSGCYKIQAINEHGCKATDDVCIDIITDFAVYIPNAITPNGDGVNDIFYVYGYSITDVHMTIFDRWGEKLFTSDDQTVGWPGTYKGVDCKTDVYVYKVDYKGLDGKIYHKTGHVSINR